MWASALACVLTGVAGAPAQAQQPNLFTTIGITTEATRDNSGIRGPYSLPAEEMPPSRTVAVAPDDEQDDVPLRMPDTTGNLPNLAAFEGQVLTLRPEDQKSYAKIHFFGTTADGSGGGDFKLTYDDGSTQTIAVSFPDWCTSGHWAIGPLSKRWRPGTSDGAPCGIFHQPAGADASKKLVSVTFPPSTSSGPPEVAYLMALTLEQPDGGFELPDMSGREPCAEETTAPVTTHTLDPAAPDGGDGWYAGAVGISLNATDEPGGSGVEQVSWRLDGGPVRPYAGTIRLDTDGAHTLEYRSIDCAGNVEAFKSVSLKVDAHAPSTAASTRPDTAYGPDGWYDGAIAVDLRGRDGEGSGVASTQYSLDGGPWTTYGGPVTIDGAGAHTLAYRSTDVAGNVEAERVLRARVDATAPQTTALIDGAAPQETYAGPVRVAFVRTDGDGSGAVSTEYRLGGGDWTPYEGSFDVVAVGEHRVDYRSRDAVGNTEPYRTVRFALLAPPAPLMTFAPAFMPTAPAPFASLTPPRRATLRALRLGRLSARVTCQGVDRAVVKLTVARPTARRLGLESRVLARRTVRCGEQARGTARLRPSAKVRRALKRSRRSVDAVLTLRAGALTDSDSVVLRRG
jgi:hypothetical protein